MLQRWLRALELLETGLLAGLLTAMVVLAGSQIILRNLFDAGLLFADPLLRVMVLWVGMLGALAAAKGNRHITMDVLGPLLPARGKAAAAAVSALFAVVVCAALAWVSLQFVFSEYASGTMVMDWLPVWLCAAVMPFGFALMTLRFALWGLNRLSDLRQS